MDENILRRMKEVEEAVLDLDESVRGAAFSMMERYILGDSAGPKTPERIGASGPGGSDRGDGGNDVVDGVEAFFADREITKPADAAYAIAGYFFSQYGSAPFTMEDVQELADQVGLTLPDRPDNTFRNATKSKKSLFRLKDGAWTTTTMGELVLKETFGIKRGRKKRPVEDDGGS